MDDDHHNIRRRRSSQIPRGTVHLQVLKFDLMIFLVNYSIEKPRPDGLALAFQERKLGQSCDEAVNMAWPGLAYLGLAWPIWAWLGLAYSLRPGLAQHYLAKMDQVTNRQPDCILAMHFYGFHIGED